MAASLFVSVQEGAAVRVCRDFVRLRTERPLQFIDLTELVDERVRRSGVREGVATVQSRHTTAAVLVNENEPLLLHDLRSALERAAPRHLPYRHDDFAQRAAVAPDEPANGHAHCQALFLRASETLGVADGRPRLGRWQSIFLVELDGPRTRTLAVTVLGT